MVVAIFDSYELARVHIDGLMYGSELSNPELRYFFIPHP